MLKGRKIPDIIFGVLLTIAVFSLGVSVSLSLYPPNQNGSTHSEQKGSASGTDERLATYALALDWLNLFLVISTFLLWRASRRSAKIAERALIELERPFIVIEVLQSGLTFTANGSVTSPISNFKYQFVNHGRTPAHLVELVETWPVVDRVTDDTDTNKFKSVLPDPIDPATHRGRSLPFGVVVGAAKPYELSANALAVMDIQRLIVRPFLHSLGSDLYFLGYVRYRDIFNVCYLLGFCAVYDFVGARFVLMGDERYNYVRQET